MGTTEQEWHRGLAEEPILEAGQSRPQGRGAEEQVYGLAEVRHRCVTQPGDTASLASLLGHQLPAWRIGEAGSVESLWLWNARSRKDRNDNLDPSLSYRSLIKGGIRPGVRSGTKNGAG